MHILSSRNRSEFLATPELIRFVLANGENGPESTLLIKTTTLTLKYLLRLKRFRLVLFRLRRNWIAYGIQLADDPDYPATLWSIFEYQDELAGAINLTTNSNCVVFLFNELALNVAWGETEINFSDHATKDMLTGAVLHPTGDESNFLLEVRSKIDALQAGNLDPVEGVAFNWSEIIEWHPLNNHYITNRAQNSLVSIFETDEGRQQEEMALWLMDNLRPTGAIRSPQIYEKSKTRELSDLLLNYENGFFLVESKTLGIWVRETLPTRKKLSRQIVKHIKKASSQLIGGANNLRRGLRVTDLQGVDIEIERRPAPHIIVLVPDLNLLWDATEYGADFFRKMCDEVDGYFHILDPAELLRIVQAAEMIAERSTSLSPMMAFDHYLMERAKRSWKAKTPDFAMLLRFAEEG